jgi:hypothetical protein
MRSARAPLDRRRRAHEALAARLTAFSDAELDQILSAEAPSWRASIHGGQSGTIDLDGATVFVKKISLTDLERSPENEGSTANLFGLPLFYQYGIGSAGFGAWRELAACLRASEWAVSGACPLFPMVYHWRRLPKAALPALSAEQRAWVDQAPDRWGRSQGVRARLRAIHEASTSIVIFLEHVPQNLHAWLKSRVAERRDSGLAADILRIHDQLDQAAAFIMQAFFKALIEQKTTPYPAVQLQDALAAQSNPRPTEG